MSCKRFLYAIVSLVLLLHTVAAQSPGTTVAQELVTAAENAGYSIDASQIQTITLPNGGSVATYALVASVDASNPLNAGVPVALQYWASSNLNGFVVVNLTSASQQALQFTLLNGTNTNIIVGTQTVSPTAANQNPVRRGVIVIIGILCVTFLGRITVCISWIIIIITPVVPPPVIAPVPVAPVPVAGNLN